MATLDRLLLSQLVIDGGGGGLLYDSVGSTLPWSHGVWVVVGMLKLRPSNEKGVLRPSNDSTSLAAWTPPVARAPGLRLRLGVTVEAWLARPWRSTRRWELGLIDGRTSAVEGARPVRSQPWPWRRRILASYCTSAASRLKLDQHRHEALDDARAPTVRHDNQWWPGVSLLRAQSRWTDETMRDKRKWATAERRRGGDG
jgi:hypothetical protein